MKKRILAVAAVALLLAFSMASTALAADFKDVPAGADYAEAVELLSDYGVLTGDENGNFNPDNTITRAEFATIICRLVGVAEDAKSIKLSSFSDVPASHWAVGYIAKANELGIINGNGDGTFSPESPVLYEEVLKMLICAWGWDEVAIEAGGWPNGYIATADEYGYTNGVTQKKGEALKRSTVALMVYNTMF